MKYLAIILMTLITSVMFTGCECITETETTTEYVTDTLYIANPDEGEILQLTLAGDPCMCEIEYGINGHTLQQTVFSNWMHDIAVDVGDSLYFYVKKPANDTHVTMGIYRNGAVWKMDLLEESNNIQWFRLLIDEL